MNFHKISKKFLEEIFLCYIFWLVLYCDLMIWSQYKFHMRLQTDLMVMPHYDVNHQISVHVWDQHEITILTRIDLNYSLHSKTFPLSKHSLQFSNLIHSTLQFIWILHVSQNLQKCPFIALMCKIWPPKYEFLLVVPLWQI